MSTPEYQMPSARDAVERSRQHLRAVIDETPVVRAVSNELRVLRERNHFGEMIELSMSRKT